MLNEFVNFCSSLERVLRNKRGTLLEPKLPLNLKGAVLPGCKRRILLVKKDIGSTVLIVELSKPDKSSKPNALSTNPSLQPMMELKDYCALHKVVLIVTG